MQRVKVNQCTCWKFCAPNSARSDSIFFSKTKVFTTQEMNVVDVVIVNDELIDVMKNNRIHKCIGKNTKVI